MYPYDTRADLGGGEHGELPGRWGNWAVAKLIEVLYNTGYLSDVGCTYRLKLHAPTAKRIASKMTVGGSHAGAEIMLLAIISGARFVEVPVNYLPRVGVSAVTGSPRKAVGVGLRKIALTLSMRRSAPSTLRRPAALAGAAPSNHDREREQLPL